MTTLTMSTRPGPGASLRPVPWRRMAWVFWRQHRLTLAGVGVLFGAAAMYLLITGLQMHHAHAAVTSCQPVPSDICQRVTMDFLETYMTSAGITAGLLHVLPPLIGAFAGAPLLAREFETGTFRYTFTQGFGRVRWTIAKLVPLAVAVTAAAAAFGVLFSWCYQPLIGPGRRSPLFPTMFDMHGLAFPAWALAAFAIGALTGVLIRRAIPAMFATLAAWTALAFTTGAYLRAHYQAPVVTTDPTITNPDWVMTQQWAKDGKPATLSMIDGALHPVDVQAVTPELFQPGPGTPANLDPIQYLVQHGFTHVTTYQPASRFWTFQWIEAGWLLALSLLLLATTVWLVRRRTT
ncbi:transporter [Acrocarpospora pleiomorpha]|uniref:Transporter n=1 Tax=Acrocarpospora pleiomorpha TaxID=90975 RepID=A0A5M3XD74_9ACTN|nr:ABC transporter permease subunit [Acrocarpospora pleiomorpha]GES17481.1 transporter [Acrocarpospora pleiomorpha]